MQAYVFHLLVLPQDPLIGLYSLRAFESNNPVFSRYFNSITCHSPLLLRIISLRPVNTEMQERLFGQAKQITKGTSSLKPNHVISNFLSEQKGHCMSCHVGTQGCVVTGQVWVCALNLERTRSGKFQLQYKKSSGY